MENLDDKAEKLRKLEAERGRIEKFLAADRKKYGGIQATAPGLAEFLNTLPSNSDNPFAVENLLSREMEIMADQEDAIFATYEEGEKALARVKKEISDLLADNLPSQ